MSTESANSFTLIGEASDGGTMENLSRRLKASCTRAGKLGYFRLDDLRGLFLPKYSMTP